MVIGLRRQKFEAVYESERSNSSLRHMLIPDIAIVLLTKLKVKNYRANKFYEMNGLSLVNIYIEGSLLEHDEHER